ncbi:hypothetical protein [Halomontanus rarus]|nr:hypothetical protein [Halovivax sp. KZCA124]
MSSEQKETVRLADTDAATEDDDGKSRARMSSLSKSGGNDDEDE